MVWTVPPHGGLAGGLGLLFLFLKHYWSDYSLLVETAAP